MADGVDGPPADVRVQPGEARGGARDRVVEHPLGVRPEGAERPVGRVAGPFEETVEELTTNMASLGHNLNSLVKAKKLAIDYVEIERKQIEETGEYSLDGLFVRLKQAIDAVKARRVLLDTAELLFLGLKNEGIVRSEDRKSVV